MNALEIKPVSISISNVDLRAVMPAVRDQGQRGTCLAFAVTSAHEYRRITEYGANQYLSEEVLFWGARECRKHQPNDTGGINVDSAAKALSAWGQPESHMWPYDETRDHTALDYRPPDEAINPDNCFRANLLTVCSAVTDILDRLGSGCAVVLTVRMSDCFFYTTNGWIDVPGPSEAIQHNHAILLVGFVEDASVAGGGYFIFRNSWGPTWGDGGYGYLPFEYVTLCGIQACVAHALS